MKLEAEVEPSRHDIDNLRSAALDKINEDGVDKYDDRDIARLTYDEDYAKRFLVENDGDIDEALSKVLETFQWRKKQSVNDITVESIPHQLFDEELLFPYNRDVDGCKILVFNIRNNERNKYATKELVNLLIYWLERLEREEFGNRISIFFDMSDITLRNIDLVLVRHMIKAFKDYYPDMINKVVVFNLSWLMTTTWNLIKSWLPKRAVHKVNHANSETVSQFVPKDQCLVAWGGSELYDFHFETEDFRELPWQRQINF